MKQFTVIIIIIFFASSCSKSHDNINIIPVNPSHAEGSSDNFFVKRHSIALETTEDNLIAKIDKIEMVDNKLYILDKIKKTISLFDEKGFYLSKINKIGQGPDEYISISDFAVKDSLIYILSRDNKKIYIYNNLGVFVRTYELDDYYDYFYLREKDLILYSNYSNNKLYNVIIVHLGDNEMIQSNKFLPFIKNQSFLYSPSPFNVNEQGDLFLCQQFDNNIYSLSQNAITNVCNIEFSTKEKIPVDFEKIGFAKMCTDYANKSVVSRISYVVKNNNLLYLLYKFEYNNYLTRVNAKTLAVKTLKLKHNKNYPFIFCEPLGFYRNHLVGYLSADNVLLFDGKFYSDKNENKILSVFDNPVLFLFQLK
ncbi:6-bladed beta-propeller [uncultured Bacteroides sp.]|uniref:6-bladed beta-propeller n=1 Tax=uncultured Bacteroides sp. TaxID=162156 RepID=UPI002AAC2A46|nr:6-bladed beta-propeller [uncultured Bacteroides sp.]